MGQHQQPSTSHWHRGMDNRSDVDHGTGKPAAAAIRILPLPADTAVGNRDPMCVYRCPGDGQTLCTSCYRRLYSVAQSLLPIFGQCMFGVAMLLIMAGIALCIWGYVGEDIRPFQIFGPVSIGVGFLIYFVGCLICCREYSAFERNAKERAKREKARRGLDILADEDIVQWIQNEPEMYDDFKQVAAQILNQQM